MATHLLSFLTDEDGYMVTVHADLAGVDLLMEKLQGLRAQLLEDNCTDFHLFSRVSGGDELTESKLNDQPAEVNQVCHVKVYGWNEEWAKRHGLKP